MQRSKYGQTVRTGLRLVLFDKTGRERGQQQISGQIVFDFTHSIPYERFSAEHFI